jgi:hypothetical protein
VTDTDFNKRNGEFTVPPVQESLQLRNVLPVDLQEMYLECSGMPAESLSYDWHAKENLEKAARWVEGVLAHSKKPQETAAFFLRAIHSLQDFDRALHAAEVLGSKPILRKDIPDHRSRSDSLGSWLKDPKRPQAVMRRIMQIGLSGIFDHWREELLVVNYFLVKKDLKWQAGMPTDAVDAMALLMETEAPDKLWMAEYVEEDVGGGKGDPIIYASYGDWQVEVARWD